MADQELSGGGLIPRPVDRFDEGFPNRAVAYTLAGGVIAQTITTTQRRTEITIEWPVVPEDAVWSLCVPLLSGLPTAVCGYRVIALPPGSHEFTPLLAPYADGFSSDLKLWKVRLKFWVLE